MSKGIFTDKSYMPGDYEISESLASSDHYGIV